MKIEAIKTIVTSPGQNFVTVRIVTECGLSGVGDGTLNGRELAVASYLDDHVIPCLLGRDPRRIEEIWQYLYRGAYWRRGPVTMAAIAAIDMALWDIKAKAAGMPLYQLLGGASRRHLMTYTHASGATIEDTVAAVSAKVSAGYPAVRAQCGIPGLGAMYGVHPLHSGDADAPKLPEEQVWSTSRYLQHVPQLFEALRAAVGWDVHLLHDVHHRLTPIEAARLGKDLEPYRLFWMEDAVPAEAQDSFRLIRQHTTTPLAVGEVFNAIWDARELISNQLIDYIRATSTHAGGVTGLRRIFEFAALHHVRTGCHGPVDISPISAGVNAHLGLWAPNAAIQEFADNSPEMHAMFPHAWTHHQGYIHPGDAPGHGVDFDETLAGEHPYEPAYLPVCRLEDGTLWNW